MDSPTDFLERLDRSPVCSECKNHWPSLVSCLDGTDRCDPCKRTADEAHLKLSQGRALLERLGTVVEDSLVRAGMSPREVGARAEAVTVEIGTAVLPLLRDLGRGVIPRRGFGISGGAGCGKTGAMAVAMNGLTYARLERELERIGTDALRPFLLWLSWPDTVNRLRIVSTSDGGIAEVDRFISTATEAEALVLDDVGAERIKGSYIDDWAASQLDLLIDARHRADRPTWFTTTLAREDLIVKYGARLFSRLVGQNALVELPALPDRRMVPRRD